MSIKFSGTFSQPGGAVAAIAKQIKALNFRAVKKVTVKFDPFSEKAIPTRDFLFYCSYPRVVKTNPYCVIKTDILCNREKPSISFQLIPAVQELEKIKTINIESENLSVIDILKAVNEHITLKAPKEEAVSTLKTKSEKKGTAGGKRK